MIINVDKFNNFLEKIKYQTSPALFKILYDKYNRPNFYNSVLQNKISDDKKKIHTIKSEFQYNNDQLSSMIFEENIIYSYYEQLYKDKILITSTLLISLFQFGLYGVLHKINLDSRTFIFLDNNRLLFNRLLTIAKAVKSFLMFNVTVSMLFCIFYTGKYFVRVYYKPKVEEEYLRNNYRRSLLIYNKQFKKYL